MNADVHFPFPEEESRTGQQKPVETSLIASLRHSGSLGKLAGALAKAQQEFKPVLKQNDNPAFRSKYADLSTVIDATQGALSKQELVVIQSPTTKGKDLTLTTMLVHSSGEWLASDLTMPATMRERFDAQAIGSAITYARRYSLQAIIGVAAEVDDDGNEASGQGSVAAAQAVAKRKLAEMKGKTDEVVPSLFYVHHKESDTYEITGPKDLLTANGDILKKHWSSVAKAIIVNGDVLDGLQYEFQQRGIPFTQLKSNG